MNVLTAINKLKRKQSKSLISSIYIRCEECNSFTKVKFAELETARFCSRKCKHKAMQGKIAWNKGKAWSKKWRTEQAKRTKKAWANGKHVNNPTNSGKPAWNKGKTCLSSRGKNNGNYKDGKYPERMKVRRCDKYKTWVKNVLEKDNFTCQKCKKRGVHLHADHIKDFALIWSKNKLKSFSDALKCEELWDIKNGRALCIPCHKERTFNVLQ